MKRYYYMSKLTGMVHLSTRPLSSPNWIEISYATYMCELPKQTRKYEASLRTKRG